MYLPFKTTTRTQTATETPPTTTITDANTTSEKRVTIIGDINVPQPALRVLEKGPQFVLTTRLSKSRLEHILQVEVASLAYHMRWHHTMNPDNKTTTPTLNSLCPFRSTRTEPPRNHKDTERAIQHLQTDLQQLVRKHDFDKTRTNTTRTDRNAITTLKSDEDITITKSDKGGEMVVMRDSQLRQLCLEHLNDTTTYEQLKNDPTNTIRINVNKNFNRILTDRHFPKALIRNLQTPSTAKTQHFYALPKTHKKELKIRPIVSACGGIFDRLGWFLQQILKPLLKHVAAHINNTNDLLQRFNNIDKINLKGMTPVSFDVVSLYTNINTEEAVETVLEYTIKHHIELHGLETYDLFELLHLLLDKNIFTYNNTHYKQIRGLAMGNRLSGTLAILCMDRFERLHIYQQLHPQLTIYVRYVDDVGTVTTDTEQANTIHTYLNEQHPTIKFEMELPDNNGYLPILDIKLNIDQDGNIHHKLYTKPASKGITLNFHSHHPSSVKRAVFANEFKRAQLCASAEHRAEAIQATPTKLTRNNYPSNWTNPHTRRRLKKKPHRPTTFTFNIPYINDKFNANVKHILTKHNIPARLTNSRGRTVRELARRPATTPSRCQSRSCPAPGICQRSSVIYKATCRICGLFYVGLTQRKLHDRAREHVTAARERSRSSALGEHYRTQHPVPEDADDKDRQPSITFEVLSQHRDILHLHIEEAMAIQSLRPPLNRRDEHLGTGFLV